VRNVGPKGTTGQLSTAVLKYEFYGKWTETVLVSRPSQAVMSKTKTTTVKTQHISRLPTTV